MLSIFLYGLIEQYYKTFQSVPAHQLLLYFNAYCGCKFVYQWTETLTTVLCDVSENVYQIGEVLPAAGQSDPEGWAVLLRLRGGIRWSWVNLVQHIIIVINH